MTTYIIKRVYEAPADNDGYRVLVDRLWPRGVSKEKAALGMWCKDIAPSGELRTWFGHVHERFAEFRQRYIKELQENSAVAELQKQVAGKSKVTLLYGAHDETMNQAVVLQEFLSK